MEGFEQQSSRLLHSSPLDTLVRRASSRRWQATKYQTQANPSIPSILVRPRYEPSSPYHAVSPSRSVADHRWPIPDSPLLHSNFRNSTCSAATTTTAFYTHWQNSKSFLSLVDDCEPDDVYHEEDNNYSSQRPQATSSHLNYNNTLHSTPSTSTHFPDLWPPAAAPTLDYTDPQMYPPPAALPTVVVSSPQDDSSHAQSNGSLRQPIVSQSGSPRLNFSRPGRPPILSSEEQKQQVLERNARRPNSPRTSPPASLNPVAGVTGVYPDRLPTSSHTSTATSYLHPDGVYSSPSLALPAGRVHLPSHPPSLRAGSPLSLYSNSYSFYQLDSAIPSPTSQSPRSTPDISPATSRPVSTEPQAPEEYLQLGIQYHEANQLKDSALCFEKSAKAQGGCGVGMLMWGLTLRHGWGCEKNEKSGFKWLTKAAESAVQDLEKAKRGLEIRGVKEELVLAIYEVGQCFFQGWGVAKDQKMAVSYYKVAAKLGDADAQQDLAFCLANGKGCKRDKKEAAKWYRSAVAQGFSDIGMAWIYKEKYKD